MDIDPGNRKAAGAIPPHFARPLTGSDKADDDATTAACVKRDRNKVFAV